MGLSVSDLESDIYDAFQHGGEGGTAEEVAQFLAFAILAYITEAEVICAPGPILIPSVPPVPSSATARKVKCSTQSVGITALQGQILASFNAMDQFALMATGIQTYAATLTVFSDPMVGSVAGATVMAAPPVFAPVIAAGSAADGSGPVHDKTAAAMADAIHVAFLATTFTGVCTAIDGGVGPVVGTLI